MYSLCLSIAYISSVTPSCQRVRDDVNISRTLPTIYNKLQHTTHARVLTHAPNSTPDLIFKFEVDATINESLYAGFMVLGNSVHERRDTHLPTSAL